MDKDITNDCRYELNDDECLPLTRCACGQEFNPWSFTLSIYRDSPDICPNCGRKLYFGVKIRVYEVVKGESK